MNDIAYRLKTIMGELSVRKFANALQMSPTTIQEYLKGRTPPADFIVRVCEHFEVDSWWLLTGQGPAPEAKPIDRETRIINQMLEGMTDEQKAEVRKYAEDKKLLAELLAERQARKAR